MYRLIAFQSMVYGEMYGESGSSWCSVSRGTTSKSLAQIDLLLNIRALATLMVMDEIQAQTPQGSPTHQGGQGADIQK